ncbi:hypothetical protein JCM11491_006422 [Sporobolomyces phaffii]
MSRLPTFLAQYCGSRPTSPVPFGNSNSRNMSSGPLMPDYFTSKNPSSQLDERDLLDSLAPAPKPDDREMSRVVDALHFLSPADSPAKPRTRGNSNGGYFGKGVRIYPDAESAGGSSLSTPSLESDYSSLSASCSPLSTPLDDSDYLPCLDLVQPSASATPSGECGIARRRKIVLPKLSIPPFQLDASYFSKPAPPPRTKPSSFQFDVSPPRRSKTAYSSSLPTTTATHASSMAPVQPTAQATSRSWNPEPLDLAGIIGERPGSPIRLRQKRRDNGFAF